MILLGIMRMICDSPSIIKGHDCQDCPKLHELAEVLDEVLDDPDVKVIIFSEWEGMLKKVRGWADKKRHRLRLAHRQRPPAETPRRNPRLPQRSRLPPLPQHRFRRRRPQPPERQRRHQLRPAWNPAKLEQRIARAWRKHQTRPVTVINLVAENTIEHAMLETLANKMHLAEGVLDGSDESLAQAKLKRGARRQPRRLQQFLGIAAVRQAPEAKAPPADPALHFAERAQRTLGSTLIHCQEAILPGDATPVLLTVLRDPSRAAAVSALFHETDWRGTRPKLQVIDEATWAGHPATRRHRPPHPQHPRHPPPHRRRPATPKPALTPEQLQRIADLKAFAAKKQKVARLLIESDLSEEAEPHQKAAEKALRRPPKN